MAATEQFPSMLLLLSFVALLCCPCSTQTDSCSVTIQIDPTGTDGNGGFNVSNNGDNQLHVYRFTSLDIALEMVVNGSLHIQAGNDTLCIHLSPGKHVLGYSQRVIAYNVVISGEGPQEVTVMCASGASFSEGSYDEFPLKFGNGSRVIVRRVGFAGCGRPLLFYETWNVTLENCLFSSFTQSAVEIYNTPYVIVRNCSFTNNTSFGVGTIRNSGNGGALSIGFNETFPNTTKPQVLIQDSKFERNNANISGNCTSVNAILSRKVYSQRGGGMACYFAATGVEVVIVVERCSFVDNKAQDSGGGVYINLSGVSGSFANMTFRETEFSRNYARHGGGLEVTFDTTKSVLLPSYLLVQDCNFSGNTAQYGGAMKPIQISSQGNLNWIRVTRSKFHKNCGTVGAAIHLESFFAGLGRFMYMNSEQNTNRIDRLQSTDRIVIENCTFTENLGVRATVFINYNHVSFTGKNVFNGNNGSAIRVAGSLLSFSGQLQFIGNSQNDDGPSGTLYVTSFAQILLNPGVSVSFVNNTGLEGGAIVVKSSRISSGFARTLYNPQCFLQFTSPKVAPIKWADYNISLHFQGNCALRAPVLYISSLDACSWFNNSGSFFNINITETWSFMSVMENYNNCGGERNSHPELYIQTELKDIRIDRPLLSSQCDLEEEENSTDVCAYPGQVIQLNVTALDQYSHATLGFLQITTQERSIEFIPTIVLAGTESDSINFQYNSTQTFTSTTVALNSTFSVTDVSETFTLRYIGCPPGFHLSSDSHQCECETRVEVLLCDLAKEFVLLDEGLWGAPPTWSRSLVTYPCPATYCNCSGSPNDNTTEGCTLSFTEPYFPCKIHRKGVLCGECQSPSGVGMLSMNCRLFGASFPMYYWLFPLLVLFDVVVVVVVVKLGVSLPALLLGFLFFIQISPTAMSQVSDSFRLFPGVMGCIASGLALYVPYDFSLHTQLTALESYGLRYTTPLLTLVVAPIAMRIKYHTRSWHGVWTLLLLMYGMAVETSASLLFCPTLTRSNNGTSETVTVWFFDGSVTCYHGAQLSLFIVAILVLVLGILAIFAAAVMVYQKEVSKWKKFSFLDRRHFEAVSLALTRPYKDGCGWWAPLELLRRYVFLIAVIFNPGYLTIPLSLASVILAIQWFIQPYKDPKANLAEAFCLTVLVILLCLGDSNNLITLVTGLSNFTLWPVFYLPVVVGFVCLFVIIIKGIWKVSTYLKAWLVKRIMIMKKKEEQICTRSESLLDQLAYSKLQSNTSSIVTTVVSTDAESVDL